MLKIIRLLCILASVAVFSAGCDKKENNIKSGDKPVIGISKIIAHPALDAIEKGVQDELKEQGLDVVFDIQSANGEISTAASIANKFRAENVRLVVGISTPMALSLANTIKDKPVIFSAVTDPIDAGLRSSNGAEKTNITGVSDMTPVKEQIELMNRIKRLKKLGHIYNAGEANSVALLKILEDVCNSMNIELITTTVTNTSEVKQASEVLGSKKVDAIYVSTDNVVAASIQSVTTTAKKYNIPVIGADPVTSANTGALLAYGVDYYIAGRQTGKMVADILRGTNPGDIPVKYMTKYDELELFVDKNTAKDLGITLPEDLK